MEFGAHGRSPAGPPGTAHSLLVKGVGALEVIDLRAVVEIDGVRRESALFTAETGGLFDVPQLEVTTNRYDAPPQAVLLMTVYVEDGTGTVMMVNLDGEVVWALPAAEGGFSLGVLPEDGGLAYNTFMPPEPEAGIQSWITRVDQRGEVVEEVDTPDAHHFFTEDREGRLAWLVGEGRNYSGLGQVIGDRVLAEGGVELFDSFKHLTVYAPPNVPVGDVLDWTHGNWLHYEPGRDSYLFSAANISTLVEFNAQGQVLDIINGRGAADGAYHYRGGSPFALQHGVHYAANGDLLMFAADDADRMRAVRYAVDRGAKLIEEVWSFGEDQDRHPSLLGEVQELPDGNILISWGAWGIVQIVSPEGEVLWEALTSFKEFVGQVHLLESPYL